MTTKTFNMKDLSDAVADQFDMSKQHAGNITAYIFDRLKTEITDGKQVRLHHFATLEARARAAGQARNPKTGERITVSARRVVKMTPSNSLKLQVSAKLA